MSQRLGRRPIGGHGNTLDIRQPQKRRDIGFVRVRKEGIPEEEQHIDGPLRNAAPHLLIPAQGARQQTMHE